MSLDTYEPDELESFTRAVLEAYEVPAEHAAIVAQALVTANLRGIDTHGVMRLDPYVSHLEAGGVKAEPDVVVSRVADTALDVDADDGLGQIATVMAADAVVDLAAEHGSGFASIRNSNHFGTCGYYTRMAAESGCIGLAMTNSAPEVAPFGGIDPVFGTNPIAYSIPTGGPFPITLDVATSVASLGKLLIAEQEGREIPDDWATDESGEPATSSDSVHALNPFGAHKGYGLALLVDVCSGLLAGMGPSTAAGELFDDFERPQRVGHFVGAIDVSAFRDREAFEADVRELMESLKSTRTRTGFDEVLIPGEIEYHTRSEREREGIPLETDVVEDLRALGEAAGVTFPAPS